MTTLRNIGCLGSAVLIAVLATGCATPLVKNPSLGDWPLYPDGPPEDQLDKRDTAPKYFVELTIAEDGDVNLVSEAFELGGQPEPANVDFVIVVWSHFDFEYLDFHRVIKRAGAPDESPVRSTLTQCVFDSDYVTPTVYEQGPKDAPFGYEYLEEWSLQQREALPDGGTRLQILIRTRVYSEAIDWEVSESSLEVRLERNRSKAFTLFRSD